MSSLSGLSGGLLAAHLGRATPHKIATKKQNVRDLGYNRYSGDNSEHMLTKSLHILFPKPYIRRRF